MTDDSLKTVEHLYKLHDVDGIQNLPFWKNTQGSILQLKQCTANHEMYLSHRGLWCTLSHRYFLLVQETSSETENCLQNRFTLLSPLLQTDTLGHVFSSCMVDIHTKIYVLRFR